MITAPRRPEDLIRGAIEVGTVQTLHQRLILVMDHPLSSAADVGKVISEDPGLTARLLRLVNSPIYGFPSRIDTVSQAISIVGMTQLRDLAIGTAFIRLFANVPGDLADMDSFWRHSIACGLAARQLAAHRREANVERFFVAGLLHDIGRPIMFTKAASDAARALRASRQTGRPLFEVEQEVFGFHHGAVGAALLERWRLPGMLIDAAAWHHAPRLAGRFPLEAAVVHSADVFANGLGLGSSGEANVPPFDPETWNSLDIPSSAVPGLLRQTEMQFDHAVTAIMGQET
ncbi:MAG: HDOD domain-containing protein [Gemmatimonadetes bacterium]|nr:HDOD domain-containing protein [Gemmatimonadota bacterium]